VHGYNVIIFVIFGDSFSFQQPILLLFLSVAFHSGLALQFKIEQTLFLSSTLFFSVLRLLTVAIISLLLRGNARLHP